MTVPLCQSTAKRGCCRIRNCSTPLACGSLHRSHPATHSRCPHSGGQEDAAMRAPLAIALASATLIAGGACSTQHPKPVTVAAVLAVSHHHDVPEPPTTTTTRPQPAVAMTWPPAPQPRPQATGGRRGAPSGNRQACILARENGGDYGRSNNPSHFGAYQFDRGTWAAAGGDPSHWGSASPAEQDAAFNNYVSKYGYGAWAPYDGC